MQALATAVAVAFGCSWSYGFVCLLLPRGRRPWLVSVVFTLGLSLGGLTLAMFWVAWLFPGRLGLLPVVAVCAAAGAVGLWFSRRDWRLDGDQAMTGWRSVWLNPALLALGGAVVLVSLSIVFNAAYWPFGDTDALAIYAPLAKRIYLTGALPIGNLYEGYPMLVPMAYAYTHWAAGGLNEYWARLVPALMALGAVGTAAALAREMLSARAGLLAAGLVVLTPLFCRWSSSGYVDVPAAFYLGLTALGAWRWLNSRTSRDALLTGIFAGLAIWTKGDGLTLLVSLPVVVLLAVFLRAGDALNRPSPRSRWAQAIGMAGAIMAVAGPWYARNLGVLGFFLPNTIWVTQAPRGLASLFVVIARPQDFLAIGWLFAASMVYAAIQVVFKGVRRTADWILLLAFVLPFFAAWWWLAGYDVRFVVTIVPLLGVMGALMLDETAEWLVTRMSPNWQRIGVWIAALLVVGMAPFALQRAVDSKRAILQNPLMTDAEKHRIRLGGLYDLALAINALPAGSRVSGVPSETLYYTDQTRLEEVSQAVTDGPPWSLACAYDYAAYDFHAKPTPEWMSVAIPILATNDGYYLYSTGLSAPAACGSSGP